MTGSDPRGGGEGDLKLSVYAELVHRLFSNAVSIGCMGVLFLIFGLYIAVRMHDGEVAILVTAGSLSAAAHVLVVHGYQRGGRPRTRDDIRRWEIRYGLAGFGSAAFVGFTGARVFLSDDLGSMSLMTGLIFGYAAGTMSRSAVRPFMTLPRIGVLVASPIVALESRLDVLFGAQGLLLASFTIAGLETMMSLHRLAVIEIELSLKEGEMARRDPLTRLANRLALDELLANHFAPDAERSMLALHCVDLDGFKAVNDTYGHPVGDLLLKTVAVRLNTLVRSDDLVVRLGGDEFMVVQRDAGHLEAERLASDLVEALGAPYRLAGNIMVQIAASVGVAMQTRLTWDATALLAEADSALYASKSRGRGTFTVLHRGSQTLSETDRLGHAS